MYIRVRLINSFRRILIYAVPSDWPTADELLYAMVVVPLQKRLVCGVIVAVIDEPSVQEKLFTIRPALSYNQSFLDRRFKRFISQCAAYYCLHIPQVYMRIASGFLSLQKQKQTTDLVNKAALGIATAHICSLQESEKQHDTCRQSVLTGEQQAALQMLIDQQQLQKVAEKCKPVLLYGVTGSGKSEVYIEFFKILLAAGKSCLFLLPEVTLAIRFTFLFKERFGEGVVYGYHSAASALEQREVWQGVYTQAACIIIGVHMPVFLPLGNLGCIVVDEEHEAGYQEKRQPKMNTREIALMRAAIYNIPIVLGSATPSIHALAMVEQGRWMCARLQERFFKTALPTMHMVSLIGQKRRPFFWISQELIDAIEKRLACGEQTMLFLNRRGYSFFVQCSNCGEIEMCPHCGVSLTLHRLDTVVLRCHYCHFQKNYPQCCLGCKSQIFIDKGIGTQQIVHAIKTLFSASRVERADLDTTIDRKKWKTIVQGMLDRTIDILVGTQTITKGYHFPHVTLVGVIWAESSLSFPFYNASETGLQQLIQVAGRAGRESGCGEVIIQTIIDHPALMYAQEDRYEQFYCFEREYRKKLSYPPYMRFVEIELRHANKQKLERIAQHIATTIRAAYGGIITVLGPAEPTVKRVQSLYVQKMYCKAERYESIQEAYKTIVLTDVDDCVAYFTPSPLC